MSQEPLFWYRPRSDGGYEGPLHNGQIEDVRKASGAWVPLFAGAAPVSAEPTDDEIIDIAVEPLGIDCDRMPYGVVVFARALLSRYSAAPVDAQPDLTQQTLDDVMAGIPARDAEIAALRKEIEALQAAQEQPAFNVLAHLQRQRQWSERTFGPGLRTAGVCDHIRKELREIEADPTDLREWVDVVILALDGAWRTGATPQKIIDAIVAKQVKNEGRVWPDWRTVDPNKAIEHDRSGEVQAQQPVSGADGLADYPTHGMSLGQRIAYVGGRENAQGYVEFGSPMAVHALIQHVLRDFHRQGRVNLTPAKQTTDPLQGAADWLVRDCGVSDPAGMANRLGIGYNRASRLVDAASKEAQP